MATQSTAASAHERETTNGRNGQARDTARQVAGVAGSVAGTVAGVAGEVGARLPEAANEATRLVRSGSDETLKLAGALSVGFAVGLLVGGANRILVTAALIPAGLIGATLMERMDGSLGMVKGA